MKIATIFNFNQLQSSKSCIPWRSTEYLPRLSFLSKYHTGVWYKGNLFYTRNKNVTVIPPVYTELCSTALGTCNLNRISSESDNSCRRWREKLINLFILHGIH